MKSDQEELFKAETPCKQCCFCEYENSLQVGCKAKRLKKFTELNQIARTDSSDDKTYFVIDRFCNYFRTEGWKSDKEDKDALDLVKRESMSSFGIVIDCEEYTDEKLQITLESLQKIEYNKNYIAIVLHLKGASNINSLVHAINILKKDYRASYLVSNSLDVKHINDYDIFSKCANRTYFTTLKLGSKVPQGLFSSIDECLNEDLARIVYFESSETSTILTELAKKNYYDYLDYDKMLEELKNKSKESNMYGLYEEEK